MKIWLDDIRNPPDPDWIVVRSVSAFKELMGHLTPMCVDLLAFDHDLADPKDTGYHCALWLVSIYEELLAKDFRYYIQSDNAPGRKHIQQLMDRHFEREHGETVSRQLRTLPSPLDSAVTSE